MPKVEYFHQEVVCTDEHGNDLFASPPYAIPVCSMCPFVTKDTGMFKVAYGADGDYIMVNGITFACTLKDDEADLCKMWKETHGRCGDFHHDIISNLYRRVRNEQRKSLNLSKRLDDAMSEGSTGVSVVQLQGELEEMRNLKQEWRNRYERILEQVRIPKTTPFEKVLEMITKKRIRKSGKND
jgi:hypothetical protein